MTSCITEAMCWDSKIRSGKLRYLSAIAGMALLSAWTSSGLLAAETARRPNIVLIVADDLGFSDLGCYGGEIRTPNLDRLAAGGLRYTQFYNAAKCHTSRASLMSGLYPHRTGCELPLTARATRNSSQRIVHSGVSIASVLRDAGYSTYASGKWHAGGQPTERGFERFFGLLGGACSYFTPAKRLRRDGGRAEIDPEEEFYFTDAITEEALGFLEGHFHSSGERPFFLYVAYTAPHWPLHAPEEDIARYRGAYAEGWESVRRKRYRRLVEMGIISGDWKLPELEPPRSWPPGHVAWEQRRMEVYAAMVDRMDQGIGRIIDKIRIRGVLDNTLFVFFSDNGGSQEEIQAHFGWVRGVMPEKTRDGRVIRGGNDPSVMPGPETTFQSVGHVWGNVNNTPFRYGKVRVHEGGIASPLIVHWPAGIPDRGGLRHQLTHVIDLLPTCSELAGTKYPAEYQGRATERLDGLSLIPTFQNRALERDSLFFEMGGNRAVRKGKWKAVAREGLKSELRNRVQLPGEHWELYDMERDRTETRDLAAEHPEVLRDLTREWERWITAAQPQPEPNIVVLIADDLGYGDLGFLPFAPEDVRTPHLDRLAAEGAYFSNAYVTSPICSASRAGIITGQYQQRWGNYSLGKSGYGLPATEPTIPKTLKALGYATKKIGKNHFGGGDGSHPWHHGFDEFLGFDGSTKDYVRLSTKDVEQLGRKNASFYTINAGPLTRHSGGRSGKVSFENTYTTDVFAEEAVEYIQRDHQGKPFYLHVAFNAVHHPQYEVNPRYLESWGLRQMMWTPHCGLSPGEWHDKHGWLGEVDPHGRRRYLACLFAMDEAVGEILRALEEQRLVRDTLVAFISDNGGSQNTYSFNGPLHGHKYTLADGGVRVPMLMRWPGRIPAGTTIETPVLSLDIFPTCVEAAGGRPPERIDGRSLLPLLEGRQKSARHAALFWDQGTAERPDWAIRVGPWKLRHAPGSGPTRNYCGASASGRPTAVRSGLVFYDYPTPSGVLLYNLEEDPGEQKNLADSLPEKVRELAELHARWRARMMDPFNPREDTKRNEPLPPRRPDAGGVSPPGDSR